MPGAGKIIPNQASVCARVKDLRILARKSQSELAALVGLTRDQLANIETGRTILGFWAGWKLCQVLDVSQRYLAIGVEPIKPFLNFNPLELEVPIGESESFLNVYTLKIGREVNMRIALLNSSAQKSTLDDSNLSVTNKEVKPLLPILLKRLQAATQERGQKAALAKHLDVLPQMVSQWLSGTREPGGETTLRLLHWVEQQERKK